MRGGAKGGDLVNGCCESKSWALSERDLNKFIMKDATMRCVLSRSVASKTDTEGCISFTCIANRRYLAKIRGISKRVFFSLISPYSKSYVEIREIDPLSVIVPISKIRKPHLPIGLNISNTLYRADVPSKKWFRIVFREDQHQQRNNQRPEGPVNRNDDR